MLVYQKVSLNALLHHAIGSSPEIKYHKLQHFDGGPPLLKGTHSHGYSFLTTEGVF